MPVVAGGLSSSRAVRLPSLLVNTSASTTMMNTAAAIHPHGVGAPILRSISMRSKSLGSVMATSKLSWDDSVIESCPMTTPGKTHCSGVWNRPAWSKSRFGQRLFGLAVEDQLGLRDDSGELAVATGDTRLQQMVVRPRCNGMQMARAVSPFGTAA